MTDLYEAQRHLVFQIGKAPTGSSLKFHLMNAADDLSKAIEAQERAERQAPTPPMNGEARNG